MRALRPSQHGIVRVHRGLLPSAGPAVDHLPHQSGGIRTTNAVPLQERTMRVILQIAWLRAMSGPLRVL
jgi:hypothetical protein